MKLQRKSSAGPLADAARGPEDPVWRIARGASDCRLHGGHEQGTIDALGLEPELATDLQLVKLRCVLDLEHHS